MVKYGSLQLSKVHCVVFLLKYEDSIRENQLKTEIKSAYKSSM